MRGLPLLRRLLRPVSRRVFPAAALAAVREACCNRVRLLRRCFPAHTPPAAFAPGLRCLLAVCPPSPLFPACRPPAAFVLGPRRRGLLAICPPCALCARLFSLVFSLSCLTFASQTSFHLSLRPRRASTFFRKESRQRFAKGLRPFEPHSFALRPIFFSSALLAGLTALRAANRRLTGKRLKSPGAELSFSSVSVRRSTPAPFRRSPLISRCWPA